MNNKFEISFPAIRGIQAGREYYVAMVPLHLIPGLFRFDEESLTPELRAQRTLNKARVPEIARYITNNKKDYVFSAITASIDGAVKFIPVNKDADSNKIGVLHSNLSAKFIINDGQHRRAAIIRAITEEPDLGDETIAVVFFLDKGLERSQQMFADLNRHAIRPSRSLGLLYDHRNDLSKLSKLLAIQSNAFKGLVEMERSALSERSRKLFTLSAIYTGCQALLDQSNPDDHKVAYDLCEKYWNEVASYIPEWRMVRESKLTAGEIRKEKIHSHGIALHSLGQVGCQLIAEYPKDWKKKLSELQKIDWSRSNARLWEGRALVGGRVSKTSQNVRLTTNLIKERLGLALSPEDKRAEEAYLRGQSGRKTN